MISICTFEHGKYNNKNEFFLIAKDTHVFDDNYKLMKHCSLYDTAYLISCTLNADNNDCSESLIFKFLQLFLKDDNTVDDSRIREIITNKKHSNVVKVLEKIDIQISNNTDDNPININMSSVLLDTEIYDIVDTESEYDSKLINAFEAVVANDCSHRNDINKERPLVYKNHLDNSSNVLSGSSHFVNVKLKDIDPELEDDNDKNKSIDIYVENDAIRFILLSMSCTASAYRIVNEVCKEMKEIKTRV